MAEYAGKLPISVIIPVKNEERNIAACLESVAWADEIWIVDSHSTDGTAAVARRYTDKIEQFDYSGGFPKKKNWALRNLPFKHEWVLLLDADERVTPELRDEIYEILNWAGKAVQGLPVNGYYVNRKLIFLGRWIKHCGWYPSWNLRLFKHRLGRYEKLEAEDVENTGDVEVHEHVVLEGKAEYLKTDLLHEDFKSIYHFIERHNRYSNWDARVYHNLASGVKTSGSIGASLFGAPLERKRFIKRLWARLPFRPLIRFFWMYFLRLGFLDGRQGLIFCTLLSMHEAVIAAKIYEQQLQKEVRTMSKAVAPETPVGVARRPIAEPLLEMDEQRRAWIRGTNTKVIEVALDWVAYRWDAETIHREHSHLSLAQIHAALSYYFAHQMEFDAEIARQVERIEGQRAAAGPQPGAEELRARLREREAGGQS